MAALGPPTHALRDSWHVHLHYAATGWGGAPDDEAPLPRVGGPLALAWGRADATCDPAVARRLAAEWPQAAVCEVDGGGHRMGDARMAPAVEQAVRAWAARLG